MRSHKPNGTSGFTLVEILVVLAVIVILIAASVRVGQYVRIKAQIELVQSALGVIDTALQQYYDDVGAFPFECKDGDNNNVPDDFRRADLQTQIQAKTGATMVTISHDLNETTGGNQAVDAASSAGLWWFLNQAPNSRKILDALSPELITTLKPNSAADRLTISITLSGLVETRDLARIVDVWGVSLWYRYDSAADTFPTVISAGPDRRFGTADDIQNR